jgi:hypothetical protein
VLTVKKLPSKVLKLFKEQGAKGGAIGGKRSLETMTVEQHAARAKKATNAAAGMRKAKEGEGDRQEMCRVRRRPVSWQPLISIR